jgi:hypothetical protein
MEEEVALEVVEGRSSRKEHGSRRVGVCEERMLTSYMLVKRDRRGGGRRMEGVRGKWTEERCVWRANEKGREEARKDRRRGPGL